MNAHLKQPNTLTTRALATRVAIELYSSALYVCHSRDASM